MKSELTPILSTPAASRPQTPSHLPEKLSIGMWIWSWITAATPGEPYHDLEKCVLDLKERGFNAVRIEAGLNWAFDLNGVPRGAIEFCPWVAGHGSNLSLFNARGGGRHDVLKRLLQLFRLAKKHGVFVILTDWEYQDSTSFVADLAIREEVNSVPLEERYMLLAKQHARLLDVLKTEGLEKQVAFVEIMNEPYYSQVAGSRDYPGDGQALHEAAIEYLRAKHPDILVAHDGEPISIPNNCQVLDLHIYGGSSLYFNHLWKQTIWSEDFKPEDPLSLDALKRVLKEDFTPWDQYMKPAENIREFWRPVMWLYDNLDNEKWDAWAAELYGQHKEQLQEEVKNRYAQKAAEAKLRNLPLVIGEGGFFYPPRLSRFEATQPALDFFELYADLAIEHGYWGFMPHTYIGADTLIWNENPEWLRRINRKFQNG